MVEVMAVADWWVVSIDFHSSLYNRIRIAGNQPVEYKADSQQCSMSLAELRCIVWGSTDIGLRGIRPACIVGSVWDVAVG